jgi:hypothetical protein
MSDPNRIDPDTVVPNQHHVIEQGDIAVRSEPEERQAVEVPAMRYVLGLGLGLAIVAMIAVYILFAPGTT